MRKWLLFSLIFLLVGCSKQTIVSNENSSIVYEIFPYSYYDSDNNGVGDLNGITEKLDYIQSLGVGNIWLTPISDGESYHMYDVVDYKSIDPIFGTMEDFDRLVAEAQDRNIGIIFDLVLNHTSSKHPWFIQAKEDVINGRCDEVGSKCDWYHFSTEKKTGYTSMGKGYSYESVFWSEMPDLNLDNEEVRKEIQSIVEFWLDHGVAGFRLDASYHYYAGNTAKNNEFLAWLEEIIHSYNEDAFIVSEVWADSSTILKHYESGIDSFFNFDASSTNGKIVSSIRSENGVSLAKWLVKMNQSIKEKNPDAMDSVFLSNHDQGRSGAFFKDQEKTKLMASVLLLSPGKVYLYYGEEIGMLGSGDDPNKRMPMLWSSEDKTGIPYNPPGVNYTNQVSTSVQEQLKEENSLLKHYQKVANIRNSSTLYEKGSVETVEVDDEAIYAMKFYDDEQALIVFHNFSSECKTIKINVETTGIDSTNSNNKIKNGELTLQPNSSSVIYLK